MHFQSFSLVKYYNTSSDQNQYLHLKNFSIFLSEKISKPQEIVAYCCTTISYNL